MKYRAFGRTGLEISRIVFGAGAVGGVAFRGDPETRMQAVRLALDHGINWIDTAPGYGDGESEENLGRILEELGERPHLSTKVRLSPDDLDDIPGAVERSVSESLGRLRQPSVDLVQLHNRIGSEGDAASGVLGVDAVLGAGGVADALDRVRDQGLMRFVGFTALGETAALRQVVDSGRFDSMQSYYNLLNPSAGWPVPAAVSAQDYGLVIAAASAAGLAVLNIRVLAAGVIAGQEPPGRSAPLSPGSDAESDRARLALVEDALTGEEGTMAQRALRFALMHKGISGVLVGFSTLDQIDEAVRAVEMPPLSAEAVGRLNALYESDFGRVA